VAEDQRHLAHGLPGVDEGRRARQPLVNQERSCRPRDMAVAMVDSHYLPYGVNQVPGIHKRT
jgi:hypothetical protein